MFVEPDLRLFANLAIEGTKRFVEQQDIRAEYANEAGPVLSFWLPSFDDPAASAYDREPGKSRCDTAFQVGIALPAFRLTTASNEGVIFTINGQAQGYIKAAFFARRKVGLQRLRAGLDAIVPWILAVPGAAENLWQHIWTRIPILQGKSCAVWSRCLSASQARTCQPCLELFSDTGSHPGRRA